MRERASDYSCPGQKRVMGLDTYQGGTIGCKKVSVSPAAKRPSREARLTEGKSDSAGDGAARDDLDSVVGSGDGAVVLAGVEGGGASVEGSGAGEGREREGSRGEEGVGEHERKMEIRGVGDGWGRRSERAGCERDQERTDAATLRVASPPLTSCPSRSASGTKRARLMRVRSLSRTHEMRTGDK